jgi:hypothetical protein
MRYLIILAAAFVTAKLPAQTKAKDSFAISVLNTVDKVLRIAEDPKQLAMKLAAEPIRLNRNGAMTYHSSVPFPGNVSTEFEQTHTRRDLGSTDWQWQVRLLDFPKGQQTAQITATKIKVDSLLLSFASRKRTSYPDGTYEVSTYSWTNSNYYDSDALFLVVRLKKKLHNTEQQAIDSLLKLYKPLMADTRIAHDKAGSFANAFKLEDISEAKTKEVYSGVLKEISNKNLNAAYQLMLNAPSFVDLQAITAQFTEAQRTQIRVLAKKDIDEFYGTTNKPSSDPVIEKQKEIKEKQAPADPCEREIWELSIKPGYYVAGNNRVAYVRDYSCANNRYTIVWMDVSKNNRLVAEGLSVEEMKAYRHTSAAPFIVCSNCRGIGYSMEYDWYQVNVASNTYARSNDLRKYTCGVCSGAGHIKVR